MRKRINWFRAWLAWHIMPRAMRDEIAHGYALTLGVRVLESLGDVTEYLKAEAERKEQPIQ